MTPPYAHVAVAIDHSAPAAAALRMAARLAGKSARLSVLHVVPPVPQYHSISGRVVPVSPGTHRAAELWLAGVASEFPGSQPVLIDGGHPGDEIIRWCDANEPDLIVVAPHQGLLSRAMTGSMVRFVIQHASVPVLVVRQAHGREGSDR